MTCDWYKSKSRLGTQVVYDCLLYSHARQNGLRLDEYQPGVTRLPRIQRKRNWDTEVMQTGTECSIFASRDRRRRLFLINSATGPKYFLLFLLETHTAADPIAWTSSTWCQVDVGYTEYSKPTAVANGLIITCCRSRLPCCPYLPATYLTPHLRLSSCHH